MLERKEARLAALASCAADPASALRLVCVAGESEAFVKENKAC
jgi:hypothetical protein